MSSNSGPAWRDVPPGARIPFDALGEERRALAESLLQVESRQLVPPPATEQFDQAPMNPPEAPDAFRIELDLRDPPARPARAEAAEPTLFNGVEARMVLAESRRFAQDPDRALATYREDPETWGGAYISGDELARMLPTRARLPWLTYALGGASLATLPRTLFGNRVAIPARPGERVLLTMGMPASGKTTLVKSGFGRRFFAVVDTPLGDFDLARELIREVQASGRGVSLVLAWRPVAEAARGMLDRAMPGHEERAVPLLDMAEIVLKGLNLFQRLADLNRHDGDTTLDVVASAAGTRAWHAGDEAAAFLAGSREQLLGMPESILGQLVQAWRLAVARQEGQGAVIPPILRAIAEDGVPPGAFLTPRTGTPPAGPRECAPAPKGVRSLLQFPGWREWIPAHLAAADALEHRLRNG